MSFIRSIQPTSHPHAERFWLGKAIFPEIGCSFYSAEEAREDRRAAALFAVSGTLSVFWVKDSVTVRRHPKIAIDVWRQEISQVLEKLSAPPQP